MEPKLQTTYPNGRKIKRTYNANDQLKQVIEEANQNDIIAQFEYENADFVGINYIDSRKLERRILVQTPRVCNLW